jgi:hypothetical protein
MPAPEEFYGNATYTGGSPVAAGTDIIAMDQHGKIVGRFTMTEDGVYGDRYKSSPKLIINAEYPDDVISFYIGSAKSIKTMVFDSGSTKRYDITIPLSAKPTQTQVVRNTTRPTFVPTPTQIKNITQNATIIQTPTPTPTPKLNGTLINNIPTPTLVPTLVPVDNTTSKFLGVLLVCIGICVFGAIITYFILTKKMKRDDDEEIIL